MLSHVRMPLMTSSKQPIGCQQKHVARVMTSVKINTEHVQGLGANGKAAFSPKAHG